MSIPIFKTVSELQAQLQAWRDAHESIALVPTMGALHEGHLSLVREALESADKVVASVFVNPTQFAPTDDFDSYPRDLEGDAKKLAKAGAHVVFAPSAEELYPDGLKIDRKAGEMGEGLEGDFRPGHFDGVVTVVGKLFDIVKPDTAVFGKKDYQQLCVLKEAFGDDYAIIGTPIVRDKHGLALSSRNAYLSAEELKIARQLNVILGETAEMLHDNADADLAEARQHILDAGFDKVDYLEVWHGRVLVAAYIGKTRLIDNMPI